MTEPDDEIERDPELRYLDAALAERFAGQAPRERDVPRAVRHVRWTWLGAAAVLGVGLSVVWLATRDGAAGRHAGGQDSRPQTREVESVRAKDEADFARLLAQARFAVVVATYSSVALQPLGTGPFAELVLSDPKTIGLLGKIVTRERKLVPAGWDWLHEIRLQLDGQRAVRCAFHLLDGGKRLAVQGLGDYRVEPAEFAQWRELLLEAEWRTQRLQGLVANGEQLRRSDEGAMPVGTKKLRCAGLRDADLAALARFAELEELDLSPSATTLGARALETMPALGRLRSLKLDGLSVSTEAIVHLNTLPALHELSWRGGKLFVDRTLARQPPMSGTLRRLDLADHKNITGFELMSMVSALGAGLEKIDLTGCAGIKPEDLGWLSELMPKCVVKR